MALVEDKVKRAIMEQLGTDESEITPQASFINDLGADSLDLIEVIMAVEEEFDICIDDQDAEKIQTVQDLINQVQAKVGATK